MNSVGVEEFKTGNYRIGRELEILNHFDLSDLDDSSIEHIIYTLKHKKALIMTYVELTGLLPSYDSRLYWHDTEKLFMYMTMNDCKKSSNLHISTSVHHYGNLETDDDRLEAVLDYECARFTKHDKPLNAYETILKYKPDAEEILGDILDKYGIHSKERLDYKFNLYYEYQNELEDLFIENTLYILNLCFEYSERHNINDLLSWYNNLVRETKI